MRVGKKKDTDLTKTHKYGKLENKTKQQKTYLRVHFTPVRMAIKRTKDTKVVRM